MAKQNENRSQPEAATVKVEGKPVEKPVTVESPAIPVVGEVPRAEFENLQSLYNQVLEITKAHGEWLNKLQTMVTAIGVAKAYASPEHRLWTDDPTNLFRAQRKFLSGGQISKQDYENVLEFATEGAIFYSRIIPRQYIKNSNKESLYTHHRIAGTMQLLTAMGRYFPCDESKADYVLYVGVSDDGGDGSLWVHDPRKHPEQPREFVGVILGFTVTAPIVEQASGEKSEVKTADGK